MSDFARDEIGMLRNLAHAKWKEDPRNKAWWNRCKKLELMYDDEGVGGRADPSGRDADPNPRCRTR